MKKDFSTLQQLLQYSVQEYSSKDSFGFVGSKALTFSEFGNKSEQYSKVLRQKGIKHGDKVAVLGPNSPQWGIAYFSIVSIGAVVIPLMNDFSSLEIENILAHCEAKAIFIHQKMFDKYKPVIEKLDLIINVMDSSVVSTRLEDVASNLDEKIEISKDDLAAIIYTSGTTGKSKGVMLSHHNLCEQIKMVATLQPVLPTDTWLSVLPLSHTYECSLGLLTSMMSGSSTYYLEKAPTASVLLPALKLIRPTMMLTVPMIMEKIFRSKIHPELTKSRLFKILYSIPLMRKVMHKKAAKALYETFGGRLRFYGIGGTKLDRDVERFLLEGKFPYSIGYGLTETSPLLAGLSPSMVHLQSTGPAIEGVQLKINNPYPRTGEGEIWAKGNNVMLGYYKEPELTKEVLTEDGWFKTGDIGLMDKENRLYIRGRLKNVIIGSNGENIYPEDIESVINSFRGVMESIVVEKKGKLVAMVNFNMEEVEKHYELFKEQLSAKVDMIKMDFDEKIEFLKNELINYVNSRVSSSSRISYVIEVKSEFDKTPTQKIKRYKYAIA
ncbi:MAG: AMP-binding protein [Bacteroidales bacterium]|nr:AMP-binding protein [Bacteroidales bacterium]